MRKSYLNIFFITLFVSQSSFCQKRIPGTFDEVNDFLNQWCKQNFNNCYSGREFKEIAFIEHYTRMTENDVEYEWVQGKLHYSNYIGLPQSVVFQVYIYSDKVKFQKQTLSVSTGKLEWETCIKYR